MALHPVTDQFSQFLRLAFLRSPNYAAGVSGWTINQDGSAEFNNLTIRGTFQGTNFLINASGAFFYSGVPAAGNLIGSIANAGGTDSHGNVYLAGVVRYDASLILAVQLNLGGIVFYTAPSEAGPWTQQGSIGDSLWAEPAASAISFQIGAVTPLSMSSSLITAAVTLQGTLLKAIAALAGNAALVAQVTGDTNPRFQVQGSGNARWGPGNAATDTALYRSAAALLAADPVAFNNAGAAETFQAFTFANSWAQAINRASCNYRRIVIPGEVEVIGSVNVPVGFAGGQAITTAAPAAYRPVSPQSLIGLDVTTNLAVRLSWGTNGILLFQGPVANTAVGNNIDIPAQRFHLTD